MIAHTVATPVLGREGVVTGGNRGAAYAELDGFVVALTARGVPLMPNGIGLAGPAPPAGTRFTADAPHTWDPTLQLNDDPARRGEEILTALDGSRTVGSDPLTCAVERRDPELAARTAADLIGRGPGLTPEGDDVVAATAAVVAAGPWPPDERAAWLRALLGPDLRRRTTALSATLLELAAEGATIEPLHGLFADDWRPALDRLLRLGHSTGRAYARAAAGAATRLPAP
jgi:hypothetical protein